MKNFLWMMLDFAIAALIVLAVWIVDYKLPQKGIKAVKIQNMPKQQKADDGTSEAEVLPGLLRQTSVKKDAQDWREKFSDKFTDHAVITETSYTSPSLSVQLSYSQYDTGRLDSTDSGKHKKYGTKISYVLADIYVGDITCIQTAFAQDTYGVGYFEKLSDMSAWMKAVLAVNGDSYSNNRHRENGTVIRNGVVYRNRQSDAETCVLNWNGTMDIYSPGKIALSELIKKGAYQSWIFGPSLLNENGKAKTEFMQLCLHGCEITGLVQSIYGFFRARLLCAAHVMGRYSITGSYGKNGIGDFCYIFMDDGGRCR